MVALWNCYILLSILYVVCVLYYIRNVCVRLCLAYQFFLHTAKFTKSRFQVWMEKTSVKESCYFHALPHHIHIRVRCICVLCFIYNRNCQYKNGLAQYSSSIEFPNWISYVLDQVDFLAVVILLFLPYIYFFFNTLCYVHFSLGFIRMHNYAQAHNVYQYSMELCKTKSIRLSRNRVKLYGVW